jgi:hypothetical protein
MPNGIIVVSNPPPADMSPMTSSSYGASIGAMEYLPTPGTQIPASLLLAGGSQYSGAYVFQEFGLDYDGNTVQVVDLAGQTIDWANSELQPAGNLSVQFGMQTFYQLKGLDYRARQFTYLRLIVGIDEDGLTKSNAWVIRMKHF